MLLLSYVIFLAWLFFCLIMVVFILDFCWTQVLFLHYTFLLNNLFFLTPQHCLKTFCLALTFHILYQFICQHLTLRLSIFDSNTTKYNHLILYIFILQVLLHSNSAQLPFLISNVEFPIAKLHLGQPHCLSLIGMLIIFNSLLHLRISLTEVFKCQVCSLKQLILVLVLYRPSVLDRLYRFLYVHSYVNNEV